MPLNARIEALAAELLASTHHQPGQPMRELAERLDVTVLERDLGALAGVTLRGLRAVVLSPSGYDARDEFTLAHELIELHLPDWMRVAPDSLRERLCDRGAAALLLPGSVFAASARTLQRDLSALRRAWPVASWSVLARRLVDVGLAESASGWESLQLAWRYGGCPHPDEEHALAEVYSGRGRARVRRARAWRLGGEGLGRAVAMVG